MNELLLAEVWAALKTRLDTAAMRQILGALAAPDPASRLYVAGLDETTADEAGQDTDWKRLVIVPRQTLWSEMEGAGETRKLGFLIVVEGNDFRAPGYSPLIGLERAQREAYRQLSGWTPGVLGETLVAMPMYRVRAPQPIPQRDDARGLVYLSAEYRTEVAGVMPA